jgi:hypothetical protein
MYDTDNYLPVAPSQLSFVEEFQVGILKLITALPPGTGIYAPTCLVHCLSGQASFNVPLVQQTSLNTAVSHWYFNGEGVQVVSDCIGNACVDACGVDLQNSLPCDMGTVNCSALSLQAGVGGTTSTDESGNDAAEAPAAMAAVQKLLPLPAGARAPPPPAALLGTVAAAEAALSGAQQSSLRAAALAAPGAPPGAARASARKASSERLTLAALLIGVLMAVAGWFVANRQRGGARGGGRAGYSALSEVDLPRRTPVR